jgi:ABC-type nitrate/sulfonate/bicarbonate transport system ATPase subunit
VSSLTFGPSRQKILVANLTFGIGRGEIAVITGPSGSGKSTFLRVLAGEAYARDGQVLWAGKELRGRRRNSPPIALLEQSFPLFDELSVAENVAIATLRPFGSINTHEVALAQNILEQLGLSSEYLTRRASTLSGGEAQRVGIARAIASNCPLLLLDEPFSNLDKRSKVRAMKAILAYVRKSNACGIVVVHDDFDVLQVADLIVLFPGDGQPMVKDARGEIDLMSLARETGFAVPAGIQSITMPNGETIEFLATDPVLDLHNMEESSSALRLRIRRIAHTPLGSLVSLENPANGNPAWVFIPGSAENANTLRVGQQVLFRGARNASKLGAPQ